MGAAWAPHGQSMHHELMIHPLTLLHTLELLNQHLLDVAQDGLHGLKDAAQRTQLPKHIPKVALKGLQGVGQR